MFLVSRSAHDSYHVLLHPCSDIFHSPVLYKLILGVIPLDSMDTRMFYLEMFTFFKNTLEILGKEMGS